MGLKSFHLFFIATAILLTFGFAFWCFTAPVANSSYPFIGAFSAVCGAVLIGYSMWFKSKCKNGA